MSPFPQRNKRLWRVDETYVKVKGVWTSLYRAVDSPGNTLEFFLSSPRNAQAAKRFLTKTLGACHTVTPRVVTVDKNAAYPKALDEMKAAGIISTDIYVLAPDTPASTFEHRNQFLHFHILRLQRGAIR